MGTKVQPEWPTCAHLIDYRPTFDNHKKEDRKE